MTRRYTDRVSVQRRDDAPDRFVWRGRPYVIRAVLAHWIEAVAWWRSPSTGVVLSADEGNPPPGGHLGDDGEREFWRVEAARGSSGDAGVYDLCFDWSVGGWTVVRALD